MKALMYHYVRRADPALPHFRYLDLDDFRRQLDWLLEEHWFPTLPELLDSLANGVDQSAVVLTFDDALVDHHRHVLPELVDRGLWGIFYVPGGPYLGDGVLDVHKTHVLLGRHGGDEILRALLDIVEPWMVVPEWADDLRSRTYRKQTNDDATLEVKQILNYFTQVAARPELLARLEAHFGQPVHPEDVYVTREQLTELARAGMLLGSHAVSHRPMAQLEEADQKAEIQRSFELLDAAVGGQPRTFCYPYGGFHTFTAATERLLDEAGCLFSFNVEARAITDDDVRERRQALPRFDCNQFPHGAASGG